MKKLFMIFSALAVLLAGNGCREEFLPPESQTRTVQVSATVRMPGIAEMSRAADEGAIHPSRLDSYRRLWEQANRKKDWEVRQTE